MGDVLAAANTGQDSGLLILAFRGHQHGNPLSERLLLGVSEKPLGAPIPASDDAIEVNRVVR
jgi:hypothetical protein